MKLEKKLLDDELAAICERASEVDLGKRGEELLSGFPETEQAAVKEFLQAIKIAKELGPDFVLGKGAPPVNAVMLKARVLYLLEKSPWAWRQIELVQCFGLDVARMHNMLLVAIPCAFIDKFAEDFGMHIQYLKKSGLYGRRDERFYYYYNYKHTVENRFFMNVDVIKDKPPWYPFMETLAKSKLPLSAAELEKTLDFSDAARMTPRICRFPRGVFDKRIEIVGKRRETRYVMNKQYRKNTWARILPYLDNYKFFEQWSKDPGLGL